MPFESSVAGSISKGPSDTVVRETTLLQTFEKIDPFTLSPNVFGGRRARKGFAFQDWWIAYTIVGLLLEPMGFSYARIEGVEDLDILTADPTGSVERYYQFKSKQEGTGTWTFVKLEEEKIFSRFIDLYLQFHSTSHDENRRIQFRVVLEGDLSKDVAVLQDENPSKSPLLFTLLATAILTRAKTIAPANQRVARDFFELAAQKSSESKSVSWFNELVSTLAKNFELKDNTIRESIIAACEAAYSQFPHFIRSIEIESRAQAPPGEQSRILEEAIIARLVRTADVSAAEAAEAVTKLVSCISHESSLSHATLVDRQLLLQWLGFEAVPSLQTKPALVADFVERTTFLSEVIASLQKHQSVCTYGISKMGKSQIASRLADATGYGVSYFWFAFSGTASDEMLFYRDLAV